MEDEHSRVESTAKLNREIRDYRRSIARADLTSGLIETLAIQKGKLSSIVSKRKKQSAKGRDVYQKNSDVSV